ncbi:MAG TPA: TolC family protein [Bryobacteraceae bacterium]|nr:TolC family protein [Bryobacteraceae bacterium]
MKRNCLLPLCVGALFTCVPAKPQEKTQTTLEDLVRTSLDRNREVRALRERVSQARALARQAGVRPAPSIEAEGLSGSPLRSPGDQEFSAAFVQPIEAFGKRRNRMRVADVGIELAQVELDERSNQIAYEIETDYLSVVYERERIAVLDRVSDSLRESLRLTEARVREGDAAPLEAQLLAVELSRADAQRADAIGRLASAELELRRVAALTSSDPLPTVGPPTGGRATLPLEQLIARALEKRADLRTARLLEQQGDAQTALAKAEAHPDVTVTGRYTYLRESFENKFGLTSSGALTPIRDQFNALSVGLSIPLVTERRNRGAIEAAASGAAGARLRREHLELTIPIEVRSAYERWTAAQRMRDLLRDGVIGPSNKNLAVIREAYRLGQLRMLDVLSEQRRLTESELTYLDARVQVARALAELERVTGGLLP